MHPRKGPRLHHLVQGGMCQFICPTGDIQWVSGVWLHCFPSCRKLVQVLSPAASKEEMRIKYSNTAEVHLDDEEVLAENMPGDAEKASE